MLQKLPPEILELVAQCFTSKQDLKSLSLVSRAVHSGVYRTLWSSLDLWPIQEDELWQLNFKPVFNKDLDIFKCTRELNFNSTFDKTDGERCPHFRDQENPLGRSNHAHSRFNHLARAVESIVEVILRGHLQKFTWGLGTCVPERILGRRGILARLQPHIRALDLTTAGDCSIWDEIDLSSFRNIRDFRWRGPRVDDFDAITDVLKTNGDHLTTLELDFVSWYTLSDKMNYEPAIDPLEGMMADKFFHTRILSIKTREILEKPLFPTLVSLSLSSAPLLGRTARAFDWSILQSLTLRKCPHWDRFLAEVVQLGVPLCLKKLEIHEAGVLWDMEQKKPSGHGSLMSFITSFTGLEELFLSLVGPIDSLELWTNVVKCHGTTLKRFSHHLRAPYNPDSMACRMVDVPDFDLAPKLERLIEDNPLTKIHCPESIGLSCIPEVLGPMFSSFTQDSSNSSSLKLIHIRQSMPLPYQGGNWTDSLNGPIDILVPDSYRANLSTTARNLLPLSDSVYGQGFSTTDWKLEAQQIAESTKGFPTPAETDIDSGYPTSVDSSPSPSSWEERENIEYEKKMRVYLARLEYENGTGLREPFIRFANWAFGPNGIPSLEVIAYGDFAHGRWESRNKKWRGKRENLFLVKNALLERIDGASGGSSSGRKGHRSVHGFTVFRPSPTGPIRNGRRGWTGIETVDHLLDRNKDFLEACPVEELLDYDAVSHDD